VNTTTELAAQLRGLAESGAVELDADERQALHEAADKLDRGQGAVYVIGRLLAPFLGRLVKGKPAPAMGARIELDRRQAALDTAAKWDRVWRSTPGRVYRGPR
jgi:hypothetical protein